VDKDTELKKRIQKLEEMMRTVGFLGKVVRHFKGDLYLVLEFAEHTETGKMMVVYRALYGDCNAYVRPYEMFNEEVPEGKENPTGQKYRFELYEVKSVKGEEK